MSDLPLIDLMTGPKARRRDPQTSHAAANRAAEGIADKYKAVLAAHKAHAKTGLTDHELGAMLRRQQTSVGKRRGELRDLGLIEDSGTTRPAPSGSQATVWRITQAGMEAVGNV